MCEWFARCDNRSDGFVAHPVLGDVPTCLRCATKLDLELKDGCAQCADNVVIVDAWQSDVDPGERTVKGACGHVWPV